MQINADIHETTTRAGYKGQTSQLSPSFSCLHEDEGLHATLDKSDGCDTMTKPTKVQSALLLNVVVRERTTIFELFASEDQTLLVRGNALLVLYLCLHIVDGVRRLHLQCDRLSCQCLHENLHAATKTKDKVKSRFFLNVVVRERAAVLELLAGKNQTLLVRRDTLLVLDLGFDVIDCVGRFDFEGDGLSRQSLDENLHATAKTKH